MNEPLSPETIESISKIMEMIMTFSIYASPVLIFLGFFTHVVGLIRYSNMKASWRRDFRNGHETPEPLFEDSGTGRLAKLLTVTGVLLFFLACVLWVGLIKVPFVDPMLP